MSNPASSTVSAGTAATATQYNNVRKDAIGQIEVTTGEAYSAGDLLYIKASDGRAYKTDADAAESGICEFPLMAAEASTGAAQTKLAYTPGRLVTGLSGLTAGSRYYPSSTAGAITATEPSQDLFWRVIGKAISTTELMFAPLEMQWLPTGRQEKGYVGMGLTLLDHTYSSVGDVYYTIMKFNHTMVNAPSSITFTADVDNNFGAFSTHGTTRRWGGMCKSTADAAAAANGSAYFVTVGN